MILRNRSLAAGACILILGTASSAWSQPTPHTASGKNLTAQQMRMKKCATMSKDIEQPRRKTFMSTCLKGDQFIGNPKQTPQQRLSACAKENKGKPRKDFQAAMSSCLGNH